MTTEDQLWQIARDTLTPKELTAYELRYRHNFSLRQIALQLDLSISTVRSRLENADRKVASAARRAGAA